MWKKIKKMKENPNLQQTVEGRGFLEYEICTSPPLVECLP